MTTYGLVGNSTFLEFTGDGVTDQNQTVVQAYGLINPAVFSNTDPGINVALVLPRAQDPSALLSGDWGSRQATLKALNETGSLWTTYGANVTDYNNAVTFVQDTLSLNVLASTTDGTLTANSNYISSAASRTIWVEINTQADWQQLFGANSTLMHAPYIPNVQEPLWFWEGSLELPNELTIAGLWVDEGSRPPPSDFAPGVTVPLINGPQSPGNSHTMPHRPPQDMADLYRFPLDGENVQTGMVGLIEPANGSFLTGDPTGTQFKQRLTDYLGHVGTSGTGTVFVQGLDGQKSVSPERSLDVGIVAAVNPNSDIALYNGSGSTPATGNARSSVFTAIQSSIWGTASNLADVTVGAAPVTSSSYSQIQRMATDSPFYNAFSELYVDAALMNQTTLIAMGDGGSGGLIGNGLPNVDRNATSPYNLLVGGTSFSSVLAGSLDPTLNGTNTNFTPIYNLAMDGDPSTLWQLMSGGLWKLPVAGSPDWLVETVWNEYVTDNNTFAQSYTANNSGAGGMDTTRETPSYQSDYGLTSAIYSALGLTGRGVPDVVAPAGGNVYYTTPNKEMLGQVGEGGTSAATPFWAGLITQINYVFNDQGLRNLGYMTDLLYLASVIAPGSFNDVTIGNNVSSYSLTGTDYGGINPTGRGYEAGEGYDLASGLGSPNGLILARTLSEIAHSQSYFSSTPDVIDAVPGGWASGTSQTLLLQTVATADTTATVATGSTVIDASSDAHATYAWTSQLAQKSLQIDFDGNLLALFDGQTQGTLSQAIVATGESLSVTFNGNSTVAAQAGMSASFGFADFFSDATNSVRLAQAVAVAETAGGADDVNVVVRMRQVAGADLSLMLYKVDDYNGTISGVAPDQASYAAAAAGRAYTVLGGGTTIAGPGDGNAGHAQITGVDAGDLIAMQLTNVTNGDTFWAFSQANEMVGGEHIAHLWNYGANTWGWEDLHGGGDRDFNDLIVQLDFTSTAGSGLLVT